MDMQEIEERTDSEMEPEKKPLISIIIPVYNVENYLRKCLDSVREQTYRHVEIILVDDCSVDSSGYICGMPL